MLPAIEAIFPAGSIWVVGGAVRDRLLNRETWDFDFAVIGDPAAHAERLAKKIGGKAFRLDDQFAITRVTHPDGHQFDFGRLQGKTLEDDLDRRDFTVNAMAVPLSAWRSPAWRKSVIDRHNGLDDLKRRRVVSVSKKVFQEDPLRLLRAFRLAAELGFEIPSAVLQQIKKQKKLLKKPAPERVREEMIKLFSTDTAAPTVELMNKAGLLDVLLPGMAAMRKSGHVYYGKEGVLRHTLDSLRLLEGIFDTLNSWFPKCAKKIRTYLSSILSGHPRSAHLKWAILLHDIGKPETAKVRDGRLRFFEHEHAGADKIVDLAKRFRWSSDESRLYERLVRNHMRPGNLATHETVTDKALHRFFRDMGEEAIGMLLVSLGDHLSYLTPKERKKRASPHEKLTIRMMNRFCLQREKVLPERLIDGHDVIKVFKLPPSPLIGEILREVMEAQASGQVQSRDQAFAYIRSRLPALQKTQEPSS